MNKKYILGIIINSIALAGCLPPLATILMLHHEDLSHKMIQVDGFIHRIEKVYTIDELKTMMDSGQLDRIKGRTIENKKFAGEKPRIDGNYLSFSVDDLREQVDISKINEFTIYFTNNFSQNILVNKYKINKTIITDFRYQFNREKKVIIIDFSNQLPAEIEIIVSKYGRYGASTLKKFKSALYEKGSHTLVWEIPDKSIKKGRYHLYISAQDNKYFDSSGISFEID